MSDRLQTRGVSRPGAFLGRVSSRVRSAAADICRRDPGRRLLDVGCGNGLLFAEIGETQAVYFGLDADLQLLGEGAEILSDNGIRPARFTLGDAGSLPYLDGIFDRVLLLNTLINVPTDDLVERFVRELVRITAPGGTIVLDIRNRANWLLRIRYWMHNRRADFTTRGYSLRWMRDLFRTHGCRIRATHPIGPWMPFGASGVVIEACKLPD